MAILVTLNTGDIAYNGIAYNLFLKRDFTYNNNKKIMCNVK